MMGMFRSATNDSVSFYEFMTISEEEGSLILRIKHFSRDMKGWEEKDRSVEFKLVKIEDKTMYFEDFTIELTDETTLNIFVVVNSVGDKKEEMQFTYNRRAE